MSSINHFELDSPISEYAAKTANRERWQIDRHDAMFGTDVEELVADGLSLYHTYRKNESHLWETGEALSQEQFDVQMANCIEDYRVWTCLSQMVARLIKRVHGLGNTIPRQDEFLLALDEAKNIVENNDVANELAGQLPDPFVATGSPDTDRYGS